MRSIFSGNRQSTPLGPPKPIDVTTREPSNAETLQAVRQRQRDKQRQFVMHMMRAEKDRDVARDQNDQHKSTTAEADRLRLSDAADALAQQIMIIERIMEEFGVTLDLEEEARVDREMLEDSRHAYEQGMEDARTDLREANAQGEYIATMASPFMMPSDVFDEDEAMRDLDECAKQTGRA